MTQGASEGSLPARTIDVDIVLRERGTFWSALLVAPVFLVLVHLEDMMHRTASPWVLKGVFAGIAFLCAWVELVLYPPWVTIGARGVAFGYWFRHWRFSWNEVDSFALGNPDLPEHAYVLVRNHRGPSAARAVRLPKLRTHSPRQLMLLLQSKEHIFAGRADGG